MGKVFIRRARHEIIATVYCCGTKLYVRSTYITCMANSRIRTSYHSNRRHSLCRGRPICIPFTQKNVFHRFYAISIIGFRFLKSSYPAAATVFTSVLPSWIALTVSRIVEKSLNSVKGTFPFTQYVTRSTKR
jgi:hypothetical protein